MTEPPKSTDSGISLDGLLELIERHRRQLPPTYYTTSHHMPRDPGTGERLVVTLPPAVTGLPTDLYVMHPDLVPEIKREASHLNWREPTDEEWQEAAMANARRAILDMQRSYYHAKPRPTER